jgi:hypothetical protein
VPGFLFGVQRHGCSMNVQQKARQKIAGLVFFAEIVRAVSDAGETQFERAL